MTTLAQDTFTDSSGLALASHTPDIGAAWSLHPSYTGVVKIASTNRARGDDTNAGVYVSGTVPANADYSVECDVNRINFDVHVYGGVVARCNSAADTMYRAYFTTASNSIVLDKVVAGVVTNLGSYALSGAFFREADIGTYKVRLVCTGTNIEVFIIDPGAIAPANTTYTSRISVTDSDIAAIGKGGIYLLDNATPSDTAGVHLDNFLLNGTAGGAASKLYYRALHGMG
jgi:hypothetical protein